MENSIKSLIMKRAGDALNFDNCALVAFTMHGKNDWEVYFPGSDYSVRGSKGDALKEILEWMEEAEVFSK